MRLSDQHIAKFQKLYHEHFGKEISKEEAREQGIKLVRLVELVYRPLSADEERRIQNEIIASNV